MKHLIVKHRVWTCSEHGVLNTPCSCHVQIQSSQELHDDQILNMITEIYCNNIHNFQQIIH